MLAVLLSGLVGCGPKEQKQILLQASKWNKETENNTTTTTNNSEVTEKNFKGTSQRQMKEYFAWRVARKDITLFMVVIPER